MKYRKFVNIEIKDQGNIGVIDLGEIDALEAGVDIKVKRIIEPKLIKALESYFDCPVKIRQIEVSSVLGHVEASATVVIELDSEDTVEIVKLFETWIY